MPAILRRSLLLICLLVSTQVYASDGGTPEEAKAMALKAALFLQQQGPDKAFPVFNDKAGPFHDRDLYVMVYDTTGKNVSHGANTALIGKDLIDLKDTDGKYLIRDLVSVKDQSFIDYKWPHPATKKIEPKTTYVVRVGDYLVGVGAYR
jgi:hypothetical protein